MSGATVIFKYSRVKSNVLAPVSRDPVLQHMSAWHLRQHEQRVRSARPWEQAHVNPGRRRKQPTETQDVTQLNERNKIMNRNSNNKRPSSCTRLVSNSSTPSQQCGKTIRNTTPVLGPEHIKWQAHAASHAKQAQETKNFFQPHILESSVSSRLRNSRHYQQPRVKKQPPKSCLRNNEAMNNQVGKVWPVPSSCSSSSSGDSAYEAGGSSPPSRGSTPRLSLAQSRRSSRQSSASSEVSQLSNKQSQASVIAKHSSEILPKEDVTYSSNPQPPSEQESLLDTSFSPIMPLSRNNDLEYAIFEHDLMSEIVSAGLLTNSAVKQACRAHMATYHGRLEQDKMEEIIFRLHKLLDVPSDDSYDLACFGLGSSADVLSNQSPHLALAEEWAGVCKSQDLSITSVETPRDNEVELEEGYSSPVENCILNEES